MTRLVLVALLALVSVSAAGCDRPELEECERLCLRYAELMHWERFEQEAAGKSEAEAAELRAQFESEWQKILAREHDTGKANCISSCRRSGDSDMIACVDRAETADEARACIPTE